MRDAITIPSLQRQRAAGIDRRWRDDAGGDMDYLSHAEALAVLFILRHTNRNGT